MSQPDPTELEQSPAAQFLKGLIDMSERAVNETLGHERSRAAAIELSARALKIAESTLPLIAALHPPERPIVCREGCTFCCRLPIVMTDVPTVFRLGFQVASALPRETMVRIATSLKNADRPCAFLVNDACAVYEDRPIVCRSYNAFDASACAEGRFLTAGSDATGLELGHPWPYGVGAAIQQGLASGLAALGIDPRQVPLVPALRMLAGDIDAAERWLRGEPAFAQLVEFH